MSKIFKSLSFNLDRLCHLAILYLDQHAHTLHHLESLLEEASNVEIDPKVLASAKGGQEFKKIQDLDDLAPITKKKKNKIVGILMISLGKRYERLKKIPGELGIQSALSAPAQTQSQSSGKKRKHMELEPEIRIPGLECNKSLPEGVPFFNNMVIEEPEYDMFFNDVFGDVAL
ncbi:hypothetical protein Tco_0738956 [Tanacetum coccineum]